jgi:subtilisin family serine protease
LAASPAPGGPAQIGGDLVLGAGPDVEGGYATDHVLVRVLPGVRFERRGDGWRVVDGRRFPAPRVVLDRTVRTLAAARTTVVERVFPTLAHAERGAALGLDRVFRVGVPRGTDTPALARALGASGLFDRVELDGIGGLAGSVPNDPEFALQYGLHNVGQLIGGIPGVVDADVDAPEAFSLVAGLGIDTSTVTIAVLDSGINQHVQLAGRVLPGWNIPLNSSVTSDGCQSHGTHVSGILAATGNDGVGTAGLAWQAKLVPYVIVNPCSGFESWVATGLVMATDAGHRLVNMSLQYFAGTQTLRDAVLYADAADVVMVAAAGNQGGPNLSFPARWPETIAVAALTNTDLPASFSNFGAEVDFAAAGNAVRSLAGVSSYDTKNGTSQATPHVTGTIALMLARNPSLTSDEIRAILQATAVDVGAPGWDDKTGWGRVNAAAALAAVPAPMPADLDGDGAVGPSDLAILLGAWGSCADCDGACQADLDGDCAVGPSDLALLLGGWS